MGGAGVAVPPGAWSLNCLVISFLAMAALCQLKRPSDKGRGIVLVWYDFVHAPVHIFSICQYSSSSGVGRPKIVVTMRTMPLSGMISSTVPSKLMNAPSVTLILSPLAYSVL